jgi:hypothetical protein
MSDLESMCIEGLRKHEQDAIERGCAELRSLRAENEHLRRDAETWRRVKVAVLEPDRQRSVFAIVTREIEADHG